MKKLLKLMAIICLITTACSNDKAAKNAPTQAVVPEKTADSLQNYFQLVLKKDITVPHIGVAQFVKQYSDSFPFGVDQHFSKNKNNTFVFKERMGKQLTLKIFSPKGNVTESDYLAFIKTQNGICPLGQGLAIAWLTAKDELRALPNIIDGTSKSFIGMTAEIYGSHLQPHNPEIFNLSYNQSGWTEIYRPLNTIFSRPYLVMFEDNSASSNPQTQGSGTSNTTVYDPSDQSGEKAAMMEESTALFGAEGNQ